MDSQITSDKCSNNIIDIHVLIYYKQISPSIFFRQYNMAEIKHHEKNIDNIVIGTTFDSMGSLPHYLMELSNVQIVNSRATVQTLCC